MIKLKLLLENEIKLDKDNNLYLPSADLIPLEVWDKISNIMRAKGYDSRGGADAKRAVSKWIETKGYISHIAYEDWIDAISRVLKLTAPDKTELAYNPKRVIQAAVKYFGITNNLKLAGYILPDGKALILSSSGFSGRDLDHREIVHVYNKLKINLGDSGSDYMRDFMKLGAIRIGGGSGSIDIAKKPTTFQIEPLRKFINIHEGEVAIDINDPTAGADHKQYSKGTSSARILADILTFYKTGYLGSQSEIQKFITEGLESDHITIKDVEQFADNKHRDRHIISMLETIIEFYYDETDEGKRREAAKYLEILNSAYDHIKSIITKLNVPFCDIRFVKEYLFGQNEYHATAEEFFPFPLYIAASHNVEDTIGVMVDWNGSVLEIHEGNDEATPETINLVNKLVNPKGKAVRIYASHNANVVFKIDETGYLPQNLYVSPNKEHAKSYLDIEGTRNMFTGIIDINSVSQESDLDWKTIGTTKIEKFRYI